MTSASRRVRPLRHHIRRRAKIFVPFCCTKYPTHRIWFLPSCSLAFACNSQVLYGRRQPGTRSAPVAALAAAGGAFQGRMKAFRDSGHGSAAMSRERHVEAVASEGDAPSGAQEAHNYRKQDQLFHMVMHLPCALVAVSEAVQVQPLGCYFTASPSPLTPLLYRPATCRPDSCRTAASTPSERATHAVQCALR